MPDKDSSPTGRSDRPYDTRDFRYNNDFRSPVETGRGIDRARPAAETSGQMSGMYYDAAQSEFARMVIVESDLASDDRREAAKRAAIARRRARRETQILIQIIDGTKITKPRADRYAPSLFLDLLVPAAQAQDMHANLEDLVPVWIERHGPHKAIWVQRLETARLIIGCWWQPVWTLVDRLLKIVRLGG